jgi:serine/threonine-protein kinase RsbW
MEGASAGNAIETLKGNDWTLHTGLDILEPAEEELSERLRQAGWSEGEIYGMVEMAFHEALINAIAHGNLGLPSKQENENPGELIKAELNAHPEKKNKKIMVHVEVGSERVFIKITDQGNGFNPEAVPDPTSQETILKKEGRGIAWMKKFFDKVKYEEHGTVVTMEKTKEKKGE